MSLDMIKAQMMDKLEAILSRDYTPKKDEKVTKVSHFEAFFRPGK